MKTFPSKLFITFLLSISCFFIFSACQKDEVCVLEEPCEEIADYMPLKVGNYWIYKVISYNEGVNSGGIFVNNDTVRVTGKRLIDSLEYFEIVQSPWRHLGLHRDTLYWRYSAGYIIDSDGAPIFSTTDFSNPLYEKVITYRGVFAEIQHFVEDSTFSYRTDLGAFNCKEAKYCLREYQEDKIFHTNRSCFAKDVGIVFQYYTTIDHNNEFRRELIEYNLEE